MQGNIIIQRRVNAARAEAIRQGQQTQLPKCSREGEPEQRQHDQRR